MMRRSRRREPTVLHTRFVGPYDGGPVRVRLRRTKNWRKPPGTVVVARPSRWGNPFRVGTFLDCGPAGTELVPIDQALAVALFRSWVLGQPALVEQIRTELAGCHLGCWCDLRDPCHADVLLTIANNRPTEET